MSTQGSTRRDFPSSCSQNSSEESEQCDEPADIMIHSIYFGSVGGLLPGTDEANKKVSGVTRWKNTETKTSSSQNPVAGGGSAGCVQELSTRSEHPGRIRSVDGGKGGDAAPEVTAAESSRRVHTPHTKLTYICLHRTNFLILMFLRAM